MEFNKDGSLEPGLHEIDKDEFENLFVKQFSTSQTRQIIYNSLVQWKNQLTSHYRIYEIWVDGSFVTNKTNPNDVDVVVFVHAQDYMKLAQNWESVRSANRIDAYMTLAICDESKKALEESQYWEFVNNRNYWRGQFGFDRNDLPKGIIVLKCEQQSTANQGGVS